MVLAGDLTKEKRGRYALAKDPLYPCQESQVVRSDYDAIEKNSVLKPPEPDSTKDGCQVVRNDAPQPDNLTDLTGGLRGDPEVFNPEAWS